MRKVSLILLAVLLTVMSAVPALAAVPTECANNWFWNMFKRPEITQPTVPSPPRETKTEVTPVPKDTKVNTPVQNNLTADENYIFQQVNLERAKAGLAPLKIDYRLVQTARAKSQDMINNSYFNHQSPVLGSPFDQMRRAGITYRFAGENIAGTSTAEKAMIGWMNSPGHRANILNSGYTHIGIGVIDGGPYGKMFTQQFIGL